MILSPFFNHKNILVSYFINHQTAFVAAKLVGTGNSVVKFESSISGKLKFKDFICAEIFFHNPGLLLANIDLTYSPSSPLSAIIYVYNFLGVGLVNPTYKKRGYKTAIPR